MKIVLVEAYNNTSSFSSEFQIHFKDRYMLWNLICNTF